MLRGVVLLIALGGCTSPSLRSVPGDGGAPDAQVPSDAGNPDGGPGADAGSNPDGGGCLAGTFCTLPGAIPGICCAGSCVDSSNDAANCGGCGSACISGMTCTQGRCVYSSCAGALPEAVCTLAAGGLGNCCSGQCVAAAGFQSDANNCGACGQACAPGSTCSAGQCTGTCGACPAGETSLGSCVCFRDTCTGATDDTPCARPGDQGTFPLSYPSGICCGGACVDFAFDPAHCGGCGACPANQFCFDYRCQAGASCSNPNQNQLCLIGSNQWGECCSGTCADVLNDNLNCNGCGETCPSNTTCQHSVCAYPDGGASQCTLSNPALPVETCPAGTFCFLGFTCVPTSCGAAGESACTNFLGGIVNYESPGVCCAAGPSGCPNLARDPNNCGACGVTCPSGVCWGGMDPSRLGTCYPNSTGTQCQGPSDCPAGTLCTDGYCVPSASACSSGPSGSVYCQTDGGTFGACCSVPGHLAWCADLLSDSANCGACSRPCDAGQSCASGLCR